MGGEKYESQGNRQVPQLDRANLSTFARAFRLSSSSGKRSEAECDPGIYAGAARSPAGEAKGNLFLHRRARVTAQACIIFRIVGMPIIGLLPSMSATSGRNVRIMLCSCYVQ
jgi:hypothetical protein